MKNSTIAATAFSLSGALAILGLIRGFETFGVLSIIPLFLGFLFTIVAMLNSKEKVVTPQMQSEKVVEKTNDTKTKKDASRSCSQVPTKKSSL